MDFGKEEAFENPIIRFLGNTFGIFPLKRNSADIEAIKISLKLLKNNELLLIFPEGTRNGLKKGIKPKNGAVLIALKTKVPIIPIGIIGSFKPFTKVILKIGSPIYLDEYFDKTKDKEVMDNLTKMLMDKVIELTKS